MPRMGPRRGQNPGEKAKDFKGAMRRLFSELKPFKILIILALILAMQVLYFLLLHQTNYLN